MKGIAMDTPPSSESLSNNIDGDVKPKKPVSRDLLMSLHHDTMSWVKQLGEETVSQQNQTSMVLLTLGELALALVELLDERS
jgi:hypothetical protein